MDLPAESCDGTFEPQTRARSNTWPCPQILNEFVNTTSNHQFQSKGLQQNMHGGTFSKKNSSRRNAWGNLSYADLITHAINSTTEKRLTLSQIYDWMVQNVPFFKDRGDSNSSAGWKNSIRHNLSLHNRFMRVQNEGTGKSSWWVLNPDAKPGKSVRRRAASMETSCYEKRRGRAKTRVEALRMVDRIINNDLTVSTSSSVSEGLDQFPESPIQSYSNGEATIKQQSPPLSSSQPYAVKIMVDQHYGRPQDQCIMNRSLTCTCLHNKREFLQDLLPPKEIGTSCFYSNNEQFNTSLVFHGKASKPSTDSRTKMTSSLLEEQGFEQQLHYQQHPTPNLKGNSLLTPIGPCIETRSHETQLDEFNIDTFNGGLECDIEELLQQEMNIDGLLDINIPLPATVTSTTTDQLSHLQLQQSSDTKEFSATLDIPHSQTSEEKYCNSSITPPSWVH